MKSFKKYLVEKITKKEFDEALNNDSILAGCEFEFYLDNSNNYSQDKENLLELVAKSDRELESYERDLNNYWKEYRKEYDRYLEAEKQIKRADGWLGDIQSQIDELNDLDTNHMTTKEYDRHKIELLTLYSELRDQKEVREDFEEIVNDWENGITEQQLLESYEPIPSLNSLRYLKDFLYELNVIGMVDISNTENQEIDEFLWTKSMEDEEIPETYEIMLEVFNIDIREIDNFGFGIPDEDTIQNELNFPVKIGAGWEVKEDGSLDPDRGGMEISTGIYQVNDLIDIIDKVFNWIEKNGSTDSDTGFHVHLSMKTKNQIDPLKLILFVEEGKIYEQFEERIGNGYAKSIKEGQIDHMDPFTLDNLQKLMKKEKLDKKLNLEKYLGLHLIELEKNHIEFRYLGGKNYHKKFAEIREVIANYSYWLSIACDPDFKRKEYLTKAAKLHNYYSYWYFNGIIEQVDIFCDRLLKKYEIDNKIMNQIKKMVLKPYTDKLKGITKPKTKPSMTLRNMDLIKARKDIRNELTNKILYYFRLKGDGSQLKQRLMK